MTGIKASKHIVACLFAFWGTFLIVLILQCNVFTDGQLHDILLSTYLLIYSFYNRALKANVCSTS